jgi:glycine/D-amino acid oxidase-like deaminating enzyme
MSETTVSGNTWYEATARRGGAYPTLAGKIEAEVCVVGGGLAGLTAALELARRGVSVALLEAKRIAWGASGRNGGFVSDGFALGIISGLSARAESCGAGRSPRESRSHPSSRSA